jgi:hypothetical protein
VEQSLQRERNLLEAFNKFEEQKKNQPNLLILKSAHDSHSDFIKRNLAAREPAMTYISKALELPLPKPLASKDLMKQASGLETNKPQPMRTEKDFLSVFEDFRSFEQQLEKFDEEVQEQLKSFNNQKPKKAGTATGVTDSDIDALLSQIKMKRGQQDAGLPMSQKGDEAS